MELKRLSPTLGVASQPTVEDIPEIAAMGFRSIICNRPDGESFDQPNFQDIEAAATAAQIETRYVPVIPGTLRAEDVKDFSSALEELPPPVLAYCLSGARSMMLASLAR